MERISEYPLIDDDTIRVNDAGKLYVDPTNLNLGSAQEVAETAIDDSTIKRNSSNKLYVNPSALIDDKTILTNSSNKMYVDFTAGSKFSSTSNTTYLYTSTSAHIPTNYGELLIGTSSTPRRGLQDNTIGCWQICSAPSSDSFANSYGASLGIGIGGSFCRIAMLTAHQVMIRPVSALTTALNDFFSVQANASWTNPDTSSSNYLLRCGKDSTSTLMASTAAYARTTTSSATCNISSTGVFRRYSSSSVKYKHDVNYLSNIEYASEEGLAAQPDPELIKELDAVIGDVDDDVQITDDGDDTNIPMDPEEGEVHVREAEEAEEDMDSILHFPVVQFHFDEGYILDDDNKNEWETGFIAEDLYKICPECVDLHDETGEPEMWNIHKVVPRMVYVIQQQQAAIEALTARVEALEA